MAELDVFEAQSRDHGLSIIVLAPGEVDADEGAVGKLESHGDEVAPGGAAELEDTAVVWGLWRHTEQRRDGGKPVRMALSIWIGVVRDFVVAR